MSDIWAGVKNVLGKVAPVLGNAIVPGVGGVAGSLLASVLGCENTPDAIEVGLHNASPETLAKIKELEMNHKERLIELATENDKLYVQDVQSARNREIELMKATGGRDFNLYALAWTIILGFFGLCSTLMFVKLPEGSSQVVFMLFGTLSSGFGAVIGYFFGSSKSSAQKTNLINMKK